MVGFFEPWENDRYRQSGPAVRLVSGREIDNPLRLFDRISKETGAESFFPKSEAELQQVIARISEHLTNPIYRLLLSAGSQ